MQSYFSSGTVVIENRSSDIKKYHVTSLEDILSKVIPHFLIYLCLTSKKFNFEDWALVAEMVKNKEHLTTEGVVKILKIAASMNSKRPFEIKYNFCNQLLRLDSTGKVNFNLPPEWVQSFLDSEAIFYNYITSLETIFIKEDLKSVNCNSSFFIKRSSTKYTWCCDSSSFKNLF